MKQIYLPGNENQYPLDRRLDRSQRESGLFKKIKVFSPCRNSNLGQYPLDRRLDRSQGKSGLFKKDTSLSPLTEFEPRIIQLVAESLYYSRSQVKCQLNQHK